MSTYLELFKSLEQSPMMRTSNPPAQLEQHVKQDSILNCVWVCIFMAFVNIVEIFMYVKTYQSHVQKYIPPQHPSLLKKYAEWGKVCGSHN